MGKWHSKFGIIFALLFIIFVIFVWINGFTCNGEFCGFIILLPVLPWVMYPNPLFEVGGWVTYAFFVILNLAIVYFAGFFIEKIYKRIRSK
jgi:hypothetical protein